MYSQICSLSNIIITLVHVLLLFLVPTHDAQNYYDTYQSCIQTVSVTSPCRKPIVGAVEYPFWGENIRPPDCGLDEFELSCEKDDLVVDIGSDSKYLVVEIIPQKSLLTLHHYYDDPLDHICASPDIGNTISNTELYSYSNDTEKLHIFHHCPADAGTIRLEPNFTCPRDSSTNSLYFFTSGLLSQAEQPLRDNLLKCKLTILLVKQKALQEYMEDPESRQDLFNDNFEVHYKINEAACNECKEYNGLCWRGTNIVNNNTCLYQNGSVLPVYQQSGKDNKTRVIIGAVAGGVVGGIVLLLLAFFILYRRRKLKRGSSAVSQNVSSYSFSMSDSEKGGGTYMGVPIFSYNELEKATNNFDPGNELGDGGFGTVYKGKLQDGREVAVKRLYENSFKRVEQFMNEIAILAKLRHPNLVVLYGSTSHECHKLLLVYEYIPNGTIADHLYDEDAKPGNLTWKRRMSIAIETASALSYLHLSTVIHRDVKTTNILLDDNFHVKVADFGLSRLFPQNFTHVSTAPQGTPGYVDPEYHQCYQLTVKSDVYSFGVVLIELISSKPAVDITRHRHEINLANLAINKIQGDALHELVDPSLGFESDYEIRNMISEVAELAFRCLQNDRESRPSMDEVHTSLKEIQTRYYGEKMQLEANVFRDDALLLKDHSQNRSPDSVTAKWDSKSTNSSSSR